MQVETNISEITYTTAVATLARIVFVSVDGSLFRSSLYSSVFRTLNYSIFCDARKAYFCIK